MNRGSCTSFGVATADADATELKVLVVAIEQTALAARISMALDNVGYRVASLAPREHPVRRLRKIRDHFAYHTWPRSKSTIRAIDQWSPDLLVCTDDLAVRELQILHQRTVTCEDNALRRMSELIELSLGPTTSFPAMLNKSDFLARVKIEGLRFPKTMVLPATRPFKSVPAELTYPIMVKADQSSGGRCVRIVNSGTHLRAAVWELQTPSRGDLDDLSAQY